jgi:hypothetical protein
MTAGKASDSTFSDEHRWRRCLWIHVIR